MVEREREREMEGERGSEQEIEKHARLMDFVYHSTRKRGGPLTAFAISFDDALSSLLV